MSQRNMDAQKLFDELSSKSIEYARKATQLSKTLENAEKLLKELPGKVEVSVHGDKGALYFDRGANDWRLLYLSDGDEEDSGELRQLLECGIVEKAEAAILLPKLLSILISTQAERLELLNTALRELESSPLLSNIIQKEEA